MPLFDVLKQYLLTTRQNEDQSIHRGILRLSSKYIDSAGRILFDHLEEGGFATFVVPGRNSWNPDSEYFKAARNAAERGLTISRLFLLPHRHYLRDATLQRHWELDVAAGIEVAFVVTGTDTQNTVSFTLSPGAMDFGVWDNEITCHIYNERMGNLVQPDEWIISRRSEDKENAKKLWRTLQSLPKLEISPKDIVNEFALEEPLIQTAPFAAMMADLFCEGDHIDAESCNWYHRIWQYLRLLDLVSTPTWHSGFYLNALCPPNIGPVSEILISGTADYSILAYVLKAYQQRSTLLNITVLDMCQTPLQLCRWYAKQQSVEIATLQSNIFALQGKNRFDLITTDAFLTRFTPDDRVNVIRTWQNVLKPGGRVVTTVRIEPDKDPTVPFRSSNAHVRSFAQRAKKLAAIWSDFVQIDPTILADQASTYAERMISWSLDTAQTIRNDFERANLSIDSFNIAQVKGEMKPTTYAQIVAYKE